MGDIDIETKKFMSNRYNFADALNFYLYGGKAVIDPDGLTELDTTAITIPFNKAGQGRSRNQKFRDVLKLWAAMEDSAAVYAILGVENETNINYAEPVKVMVYDAIQYSKQVEEILATYKSGGKRGQGGAFLYGLHKGDKIKPVVTLVLHFGEKKWDGPLDLHSMLDLPDTPEINGLKKYVPNYRLNLISPSRLKQGDFKKFSTNLGGILKYIKYSGDMDQLAKHAAELPLFEPDEAALINLITKSDLQYEVKEGKVDMCEAIRQMRVQSEAKGRTEGRNEGRAEGLMEGKLETLAELVKDNILTVAEAAKRANMTVKEFEKRNNDSNR